MTLTTGEPTMPSKPSKFSNSYYFNLFFFHRRAKGDQEKEWSINFRPPRPRPNILILVCSEGLSILSFSTLLGNCWFVLCIRLLIGLPLVNWHRILKGGAKTWCSFQVQVLLILVFNPGDTATVYLGCSCWLECMMLSKTLFKYYQEKKIGKTEITLSHQYRQAYIK